MERFISKFHIELLVLYRLYIEANGNGADLIADQISKMFINPLPIKRVRLALEALYDRSEVTFVSRNFDFYSVNNDGLKVVEGQLNSPDSFLSNFSRFGEKFLNEEFAPAADRIVTFKHNSPDAEEISQSLKQLKEDVRSANDLEIAADERARVLVALDGAQSLWDSGCFKLLQLKVGILLAADDASRLLINTSKAIAASLLVDAIKAFAKSHFKVDLDQI